MKKVFAILLAVIMLVPNSISVYAENIDETDLSTLQELVSEGNSITDYSSSDAYIWITKVYNFNEKYANSYVYSNIKSECNSAKGHSSISTFNEVNKILGYLSVVQDEIDGAEEKTVRELTVCGNALSDKASADAYKWVIDVLKTNEKFPASSVYSDIKSKCSSAKGHSSISTFNEYSQILADLALLYSEVPISTELQEIRIKKQPTKVIYSEGETFSTIGMEVLATYLNIYEDNSTDLEENLVTNYTVDKMVPLKYDDTIVTISYKENGVTKTATQNITVNPIIVSKSLKSISIVTPPTKTVYKEGETFSKAGMRVNAIYEQVWSDGSHDEGKYENVAYIVDTATPLSAQDSSITISFEDDGIIQTTQQGIIVESYMISKTLDSIVVVSNPKKLTYIEGERFDKTGLLVDAKFLTKWSNGYEEYTTEKNVAYSVNITSPLLVLNKSWTVSYIVDGIKKETNIPIVVSPRVADNKDNDDTNPTPEKVKIPTVSKVSVLKVKAGKNKLTVPWEKASRVAGYQIQISPKSNFKGAKKINIGKSKKSYTKKGLKSKKKYYVRIRAYKTYKDNGITKKVYGKWTVKSKKIK